MLLLNFFYLFFSGLQSKRHLVVLQVPKKADVSLETVLLEMPAKPKFDP